MPFFYLIIKDKLFISMDAAKIFSFFESGSLDASKSLYVAPAAVETDMHYPVLAAYNPDTLIKMFIKMVAQVDDIVADVVSFLPDAKYKDDADKHLRIQQYRFMCYNRALAYLDKINLNHPTHLDYILNLEDNLFILALDKALNFYTEIEEYKVCEQLTFYKGLSIHSLKISALY